MCQGSQSQARFATRPSGPGRVRLDSQLGGIRDYPKKLPCGPERLPGDPGRVRLDSQLRGIRGSG